MTASQIHRNSLQSGTGLQEYVVESVLGAGGFGITYLCRDTHLEKRVAIKEFFPSSLVVRALDGCVIPTQGEHQELYAQGLQRFILEARTLARFSHPHIVRVNRYFEANGTGYMVMDFEDGRPLSRVQPPGQPLGEDRARVLLAPLFDGLQAVHDAGFLHRDIKPANIFIRTTGGPVLLDFGSARHALGGVTQTLTAMVTPGFAPIEQYSADGAQGPWTDIYAMGGVLYWAVTGEYPPDAVKRLKHDTVPERLAAVSERTSLASLRAIEWALLIDERERPRSLAQWRRALNGEIEPDTLAPLTVPQTLPPHTQPPQTQPGQAPAAGVPATRVNPRGETALAARATAIAVPVTHGTVSGKAVVAEASPTPRRGLTVWHVVGLVGLGIGVLVVGQQWMQSLKQREQAAATAAAQAQQAAAAAQAAQEAVRQAQKDALELEAKAREVREREAALRVQEARLAQREPAPTGGPVVQGQGTAPVSVPAQPLAGPREPVAPRVNEPPRPVDGGLRPGGAGPFEPVRPGGPPQEGGPRFQPGQAALDEARRRDPLAARKEADFRRADVNADGYLSRDEARALPLVSENFDMIDSIHRDGRLSLDEFFQWRPFRAGGGPADEPRGPQRPPRPDGPPMPQR